MSSSQAMTTSLYSHSLKYLSDLMIMMMMQAYITAATTASMRITVLVYKKESSRTLMTLTRLLQKARHCRMSKPYTYFTKHSISSNMNFRKIYSIRYYRKILPVNEMIYFLGLANTSTGCKPLASNTDSCRSHSRVNMRKSFQKITSEILK
uniref:Uncharacterized protein n=1 Tax=Glossina brevipalpis TaxID=37001 RepID=A0A1A9W4Z8_9MUSC